MSLNRMKILLAGLALSCLLGGVAPGQHEEDLQAFAWVDDSNYGGGPRANEGLFFHYEWMHLSVLRPDVTTIGLMGDTRTVAIGTVVDPVTGDEEPVFRVQSNSHDTGFLRSPLESANWFELGYIEGHQGYTFNAFTMSTQEQRFMLNDVDVVFSDPPGVSGLKHLEGFIDENLTIIEDLPVTFEQIDVLNTVNLWGVEWMYLYRTHPGRWGGLWEFGVGVRYMEFDEGFKVNALGGILDDSTWNTEAENHLVGPVGFVRWFRKAGRWTLAAESRFFSGFNSQNIRQVGTLGSKLTNDPDADPDESNITGTQGFPLIMTASSFKHSRFFSEWSPGVELRVSFDYQVTRSISLGVGWFGFWMDGIARASNVIDYQVPNMGIDPANNRQDVFINGPILRVLWNR
ncbi:MAG TPA: hypothetical protein EYP56_16380 [Planctomycetaceae bacterium]|nr:hypothetical protein [Planctomycetaceae bacterium]